MMAALKPAWIVVFVLVGLIVAMLLMRTSEELQPDLLGVQIAVQIEGEGVARVAPAETVAGTPFRLHAVVEATDWRGQQLYYSDAEALEIDGVAVPEERIRVWHRREKVRVLWFTVEGAPPYREVATVDELDDPHYRDVFQADWPQAWTVPGQITPAVENFLPGHDERGDPSRFGTQRFHLRVEVFGAESDLLPILRLRSAGAIDIAQSETEIPRVTAILEWPLASVSRVFGLSQVEPAETASQEVAEALARQTRERLLFSRVALLRAWLAEAGVRWEELAWSAVELTGEVPWRPGAVVRAGSKVAFVYEDRGILGSLDDADLCLDFDKGATVRTLSEVFVGEGLVEVAVLESS